MEVLGGAVGLWAGDASYRAEWSRERRDFEWHRVPGAEHGAAADGRATLRLIWRMAEGAAR